MNTKLRLSKSLSLTALCFIFIGCSGGSESPQNTLSEPFVSDTTEVSGFWDLSGDFGYGYATFYYLISTTGYITHYTFITDGSDCYQVSGWRWQSLGNNQYKESNGLVSTSTADANYLYYDNGERTFQFPRIYDKTPDSLALCS